MPVEFNQDGSIKLPGFIQQKMQENEHKLRAQRCMRIRRKIVSFEPPKKCVLQITLSDTIKDSRFIEHIYNYFRESASAPTKITKVSEKEFEVEVGTDFKRCTDCISLIGRYREFLDGNLIEDKGGCTFEGFRQSFGYEDYFD